MMRFTRLSSAVSFALALCLCSSISALADSGAVAKAYPATGITIDGDLSDWPLTAITYPIDRAVYGVPGERNAEFRVAYNLEEQSIYVAVELQDPVTIIADEEALWYFNDAHLLYVDFDHSRKGSAPKLFSGQGPNANTVKETSSWSPHVRDYGLDGVDYSFSRQGDRVVYEWKIRSPEPLSAGTSLGLDHIISHIDDESTSGPDAISMWGRYSGKTQRSARLGDLLLIDPVVPTGRIQGKIDWAEGVDGPDLGGWRVRIESLDTPDLWFQPLTNDDRQFDLQLPAGRYRMTSPFPIYQQKGEEAYSLRLADKTQIEFNVVPGTTLSLPPFLWDTTSPPQVTTRPGLLFDFDAAQAADLTAFITATMDHYAITGASIALVRDGATVYARDFGERNAYTGDPVTSETLFEAGSITKMVFAVAVMRLAEQGKIDLDRPLHTYLPFDEIADDPRSKLMTARHVLSHRTGLPNWRSGELTLGFIPGTGFGYSGEGFEYLARVVAEIENRPIEDILIDHALRPMGLADDIMFKDDGTLIDRVAFGHSLHRPHVAQMPDTVGVAYSLQAHASTLATFMAGLQTRKGLSPASYDAMLTPVTKRPTPVTRENWNSYFGLGVNIVETSHGRAFGHSGLNGSNNALFETYDAQKSGFIVLTNSDAGRQFYTALRDYLVLGSSELSGN